MYNIASELYNEFLEIYFDEYIDLSDSKKKKKNRTINMIQLI